MKTHQNSLLKPVIFCLLCLTSMAYAKTNKPITMEQSLDTIIATEVISKVINHQINETSQFKFNYKVSNRNLGVPYSIQPEWIGDINNDNENDVVFTYQDVFRIGAMHLILVEIKGAKLHKLHKIVTYNMQGNFIFKPQTISNALLSIDVLERSENTDVLSEVIQLEFYIEDGDLLEKSNSACPVSALGKPLFKDESGVAIKREQFLNAHFNTVFVERYKSKEAPLAMEALRTGCENTILNFTIIRPFDENEFHFKAEDSTALIHDKLYELRQQQRQQLITYLYDNLKELKRKTYYNKLIKKSLKALKKADFNRLVLTQKDCYISLSLKNDWRVTFGIGKDSNRNFNLIANQGDAKNEQNCKLLEIFKRKNKLKNGEKLAPISIEETNEQLQGLSAFFKQISEAFLSKKNSEIMALIDENYKLEQHDKMLKGNTKQFLSELTTMPYYNAKTYSIIDLATDINLKQIETFELLDWDFDKQSSFQNGLGNVLFYVKTKQKSYQIAIAFIYYKDEHDKTIFKISGGMG